MAGIDQVEIESSECVIYTSQKSGDQLMLSVMWTVLLAISIVLLALGMFAMDFSIRLFWRVSLPWVPWLSAASYTVIINGTGTVTQS